jgi:hypothetical protein
MDWQKYYANSDGVGCNPVEVVKAARERIAELECQIQNCFSIVWGADSIDEARQRVAALLGEKQQ